MKHFINTAAFLICLGFVGPANAVFIFEATLTGAQEVPPNGSAASGTASLSLNDAQTRLEMSIFITSLDLDGLQTPGDPSDDVTGLHIHRAPFGANGPVVFGLISPASDLNNDLVVNAAIGSIFSAWDLTEGNGTTLASELSNLFSGDLYFNVHTSTFPGGEIRGQIASVPEPAIVTLMTLGLAGIRYLQNRKLIA